jgi:hypothetical protein
MVKHAGAPYLHLTPERAGIRFPYAFPSGKTHEGAIWALSTAEWPMEIKTAGHDRYQILPVLFKKNVRMDATMKKAGLPCPHRSTCSIMTCHPSLNRMEQPVPPDSLEYIIETGFIIPAPINEQRFSTDILDRYKRPETGIV